MSAAERTRAGSSARRRAEILDAALACFTERGVAATTIADVRERSGASTGSIYHHFGSKEELAAALYVEGLEGYQRGALEALGRHADARGGIEALVRQHLAWVSANPRLARYMLSSREPDVRAQTDAAMRDANRRFYAAVSGWLEPHVAAGRLRALPVALLYVIVLGPGQELARLWLRGRLALELEDAAESLAAAAWAAVRAEEDAR